MLFRKRAESARVERYEILVPLYFNDGRPVEQYKLDDTSKELGKIFKGYTQDPVRVTGYWQDSEGNPYYDESFRFRIDIPYSEENRNHFRFYKRILQLRFEQREIWVTVHNLEIV